MKGHYVALGKLDLGAAPEIPKITNNVNIKCANGSKVLLPNNYKVYYVSEDDYNNTINPATGRKIDPRDPVINGKDWKESSIKLETIDGKFSKQTHSS